jgi:phage terminase small subunit
MLRSGVMRSTARTPPRSGTTERRRTFIQAYISNGYNATDAAIAAGYSPKTARSQGHRLLTKVDASGELAVAAKASAERAELKTEEVLYQVRCGLNADPRKLFKPDGTLIPIPDLDDATAAALDIEIDVDGNVKRRFWNKSASAQTAMRHLGLYERDNTQKAEQLTFKVTFVKAAQVNTETPANSRGTTAPETGEEIIEHWNTGTRKQW